MSFPVLVLGRERAATKLDAPGFIAILIAMASYFWLSTWVDVDPGLAAKANFAATMAVAGIVIGGLITRTQLDLRLEANELVKIMMWSAVAAAGVYLGSLAQALASTPSVTWQFAVLIAAAEELFFRYAMTSVFHAWTNSKPLAVLLSAVFFAVYHVAVYGVSEILWAILAGGAVLAWVYLETRMIGPVIVGHMLVNYLATAG